MIVELMTTATLWGTIVVTEIKMPTLEHYSPTAVQKVNVMKMLEDYVQEYRDTQIQKFLYDGKALGSKTENAARAINEVRE